MDTLSPCTTLFRSCCSTVMNSNPLAPVRCLAGPRRSALIGSGLVDLVHGGLLGRGAGAVDAGVLGNELGRDVLPQALVRGDETTGAFVADLSGDRSVEHLGVALGVHLLEDVRLLLGQALIEGLALDLQIGRAHV